MFRLSSDCNLVDAYCSITVSRFVSVFGSRLQWRASERARRCVARRQCGEFDATLFPVLEDIYGALEQVGAVLARLVSVDPFDCAHGGGARRVRYGRKALAR